MGYPTEEIARRNRWEDEYQQAAREHERERMAYAELEWLHHEEEREAYLPADIAADFEE